MIGTIIGIVGVVATIVGLYITLHIVKRTSITYVKVAYLSLFQSIVKDMRNLTVQYQGNSIGPEIYLLRSAIINDGNTDVDNLSIHEPIQFTFPTSVKILEYQLVGSQKATLLLQDNVLTLTWDLLKTGEAIPFTVLVKHNDDASKIQEEHPDFLETLDKSIKIDARITNLNRIGKAEAPKASDGQSRPQIFLGLLYSGMLVLLLLFCALTYFNKKNVVAFKYQKDPATTLDVMIEAKNDDTLTLSQHPGPFKVDVPLNAFNTESIRSLYIAKEIDYLFYITAGGSLPILLAASVVWFELLSESRKRRKIKRIYQAFR
jgi:hypothetical protein